MVISKVTMALLFFLSILSCATASEGFYSGAAGAAVAPIHWELNAHEMSLNQVGI